MIRASISRLSPAVLSRSNAAAVGGAITAYMPFRRFPRLEPEQEKEEADDEARNALAYCLSFSNDESDFSRNMLQLFPDARMQEQLKNCTTTTTSTTRNKPNNNNNNMIVDVDTHPLPRTLADALRCQTSRAIVITEIHKPFRIVHVNLAWEGLCHYSFVQAQNQTLGKLLQGPETDPRAATQLIASLLAGQPEAGTTLTNYTGKGRRFRNRVRVGPLYDEDVEQHGASSSSCYSGVPTHFVAVLQEVNDGM